VRQHLSSNHSFHGPFKSTSITLCRFALVLGSNSSSCTNRHNFRWFQPRTPLPDLRNSWEAAILMCTSLVLSHNKQLEYVTMVAACYKPGTSSRVVTQFTIASWSFVITSCCNSTNNQLSTWKHFLREVSKLLLTATNLETETEARLDQPRDATVHLSPLNF